MTTLAKCACRRCREQKLRCSREQPICARCNRLDAHCSYPNPPDRKQIAAQRARPRKRKHNEGTVDMVSNDTSSEQTAAQTPHTLVSTISNVQLPATGTYLADGTALSSTMEKLLRDIYFANFFNSQLLIHRAKFDKALAEGTLPQSMLLAIYASATNFLDPPCALAENHEQEIQSMGDITSLGHQWARSAGDDVLRTIDQLTLAKLQTCQILALYWFSQADSRRSNVFFGISFQCSRELVFSEDDKTEAGILHKGIETETRRRCFWASFIPSRVNSDHYVVGSSADQLVSRVPLPTSERSFNYMIPEPPITLSDSLEDENSKGSPRSWGEPNAWRELIRLVAHWSKLHDHMDARRNQSTRESMIDLLSLDDWLVQFLRDLTPSLKYSKENLSAQVAEKQSLTFPLLHAFYLQCRLVLHTSLVPQFSGQAPLDKVPRTIIQSSARTAVESAQAISRLATDLLALDYDLAGLAPFVGYCMYVSGSIHIAFVSSRNERLRTEAWKNLEPVLKILKIQTRYWKNLQRLWTRILVLYEAQASKTAIALDESDVLSPESVEEMAETRRDSGRLVEPLADSVLQYSMQRLKRNVPVDSTSSAAQRLEEIAGSKRVAKIMHEQPQTSQLELGDPHGLDSNGNMFDKQFQAQPFQIGDTDPSAMMNFNSVDDWWPFDLDQFAQPILSYSDLFGENTTF